MPAARVITRLRRSFIAALTQQDGPVREVSAPTKIACCVVERFSCTHYPRGSALAMVSSRRQE